MNWLSTCDMFSAKSVIIFVILSVACGCEGRKLYEDSQDDEDDSMDCNDGRKIDDPILLPFLQKLRGQEMLPARMKEWVIYFDDQNASDIFGNWSKSYLTELGLSKEDQDVPYGCVYANEGTNVYVPRLTPIQDDWTEFRVMYAEQLLLDTIDKVKFYFKYDFQMGEMSKSSERLLQVLLKRARPQTIVVLSSSCNDSCRSDTANPLLTLATCGYIHDKKYNIQCESPVESFSKEFFQGTEASHFERSITPEYQVELPVQLKQELQNILDWLLKRIGQRMRNYMEMAFKKNRFRKTYMELYNKVNLQINKIKGGRTFEAARSADLIYNSLFDLNVYLNVTNTPYTFDKFHTFNLYLSYIGQFSKWQLDTTKYANFFEPLKELCLSQISIGNNLLKPAKAIFNLEEGVYDLTGVICHENILYIINGITTMNTIKSGLFDNEDCDFDTVFVLAKKNLTINEDLKLPGKNFIVFAPTWIIYKEHVIDLSGRNGASEGQIESGQSGGDFYGFGLRFDRADLLTFVTNGGDGSKGRDATAVISDDRFTKEDGRKCTIKKDKEKEILTEHGATNGGPGGSAGAVILKILRSPALNYTVIRTDGKDGRDGEIHDITFQCRNKGQATLPVHSLTVINTSAEDIKKMNESSILELFRKVIRKNSRRLSYDVLSFYKDIWTSPIIGETLDSTLNDFLSTSDYTESSKDFYEVTSQILHTQIKQSCNMTETQKILVDFALATIRMTAPAENALPSVIDITSYLKEVSNSIGKKDIEEDYFERKDEKFRKIIEEANYYLKVSLLPSLNRSITETHQYLKNNADGYLVLGNLSESRKFQENLVSNSLLRYLTEILKHVQLSLEDFVSKEEFDPSAGTFVGQSDAEKLEKKLYFFRYLRNNVTVNEMNAMNEFIKLLQKIVDEGTPKNQNICSGCKRELHYSIKELKTALHKTPHRCEKCINTVKDISKRSVRRSAEADESCEECNGNCLLCGWCQSCQEQCNMCTSCKECPWCANCHIKETISCRNCRNCAKCPECPQCIENQIPLVLRKYCEDDVDCSQFPYCPQCSEESCSLCNNCHRCPQCKGCEEDPCISCTNCEYCPDCPMCQVNHQCPTCQDCTQCPNCPQCQKNLKTSCDLCTNCSLCSHCKQCRVWPKCDSCINCKDCPNCPQCCKNCNDCSLCPQCWKCSYSTSLTTCLSCDDCSLCPQCSRCSVDICDTCADCQKCPKCPMCLMRVDLDLCDDCSCDMCPFCPQCIKRNFDEIDAGLFWSNKNMKRVSEMARNSKMIKRSETNEQSLDLCDDCSCDMCPFCPQCMKRNFDEIDAGLFWPNRNIKTLWDLVRYPKMNTGERYGEASFNICDNCSCDECPFCPECENRNFDEIDAGLFWPNGNTKTLWDLVRYLEMNTGERYGEDFCPECENRNFDEIDAGLFWPNRNIKTLWDLVRYLKMNIGERYGEDFCPECENRNFDEIDAGLFWPNRNIKTLWDLVRYLEMNTGERYGEDFCPECENRNFDEIDAGLFWPNRNIKTLWDLVRYLKMNTGERYGEASFNICGNCSCDECPFCPECENRNFDEIDAGLLWTRKNLRNLKDAGFPNQQNMNSIKKTLGIGSSNVNNFGYSNLDKQSSLYEEDKIREKWKNIEESNCSAKNPDECLEWPNVSGESCPECMKNIETLEQDVNNVIESYGQSCGSEAVKFCTDAISIVRRIMPKIGNSSENDRGYDSVPLLKCSDCNDTLDFFRDKLTAEISRCAQESNYNYREVDSKCATNEGIIFHMKGCDPETFSRTFDEIRENFLKEFSQFVTADQEYSHGLDHIQSNFGYLLTNIDMLLQEGISLSDATLNNVLYVTDALIKFKDLKMEYQKRMTELHDFSETDMYDLFSSELSMQNERLGMTSKWLNQMKKLLPWMKKVIQFLGANPKFQEVNERIREAIRLVSEIGPNVKLVERHRELRNYIKGVRVIEKKEKTTGIGQAILDLKTSFKNTFMKDIFHKAVTMAQNWVFPLTKSYLSIQNIQNKTYDTHLAAVSARVEEYRKSIMLYTTVHMFDSTRNDVPFYEWNVRTRPTLLHDLFSGKPVILVSEILDGGKKNSLMAKDFEVKFVAGQRQIPGTQEQIDDALKGLWLNLTHSGISYFKFGSRIYRRLTETFTFRHTASTVGREKVKSVVDYVLSPYTTWVLRLEPDSRGKFPIQIQDKIGSIELVGIGRYVVNCADIPDVNQYFIPLNDYSRRNEK